VFVTYTSFPNETTFSLAITEIPLFSFSPYRKLTKQPLLAQYSGKLVKGKSELM
jgi:hypothetical protein